MSRTLRRALTLPLAVFMAVSGAQGARAQDTKQEFAPKPIDAPEAAPTPQRDAGPAGPRINSTDMMRRDKEAKIARQDKAVEQKLIRMIQQKPDTDPQKPLILDRLATFYWQMAGDTQDRAYEEEDRCYQASAQTDDDLKRCEAVRKGIEQEAEASRGKAIEVYKFIVQTFPNFEEIDRILFALAFNYQQKQQNEDAKAIYTELIQNYQTSPVLPDALFNMADIFFAAGDVDSASALYGHVTQNFPKSSVYVYAIYKLGWCAYNQSDFEGALGHFVKVIDLQNALSAAEKKRNRLSLKNEAQRDLIRVYVNIEQATAAGGVALIKKYAPDRYNELAEQLADLYAGTGQFDKSNHILNSLIKESPQSYRVVGYQRRITENIANTHSAEEGILALKRLVTLWQKAKTASDADPKRVAEDHKGIELQLNAMARRYHNQALETKTERDFNTALELYETYVESFPNESTSYEMNFYYAELLYRLEKWAPSAEIYEKVLEMQPDGEFTKDAAHGALLAYKALLKDELDEASIKSIGKAPKPEAPPPAKNRKGKKGGAKEEPKPLYERKELSKEHQNYLKASALYRRYVRESEYLVDIQYEEARVYYVFNHFDEAVPLFKDIAENHPEHKVSVFAANLLLECYNRQGNFDALSEQVNVFVPLYPASRDAELAGRLKTLKSELDFQKCSMLENKGEADRAARCFLTYAKRFPESKIVDKAYFNAAVNYDRERQMEKAIEARMELIRNAQESELAPQAFFQIARNLQALAIYGAASSAYEQFAANYPKREESTEALRLAAQFRLGLGELDKAAENLKSYIKRLGKKEKQQVVAANFELGRVLQEREQWNKVVEHFMGFTKQFGKEDAGYLMMAYTALGNAYVTLPKKYQDHKKARAAYESAIKVYQTIPPAKLKDLPVEARSAAAEALFKVANYDFDVVRELPFTKFAPLKDPQKHINKITENLQMLVKEIDKVKQSFEAVLNMNVESWGLAALSQTGQMYYFAFTTLEQTTPPSIFDDETKEMFRNSMIEKAEPLRLKAVEAYKVCLDKARELQWFNEWSELAEQQLAKIDPSAFHYSMEERAKPVHFHNAPIRRELILALPEAEEEDL